MAPRSNPAPVPSSPSEPTPASEPTPPSGPTSGPLMFTSPTPDPADLPETWPSGAAVSDELPAPPEAPPTSSKASSASALSKTALREAIRKAVLMAGALANQVLARDELEQDAGLYLTDETDAEAIGDPLASIAARHGGLGAAGNPDVVDAVAAIIGAGFYLYKQLTLARVIKINRQNHPRNGAQGAGSETPEGDRTYPGEPAPLGPFAGASKIPDGF